MLGGGTHRDTAKDLISMCEKLGIPVATTTWNGSDLIGPDNPAYIGRPNTWGQRSSNIIIQQSDLLIAVGTRIGLQQSGFNWRQFIPNGYVVMVDIDEAELKKGHPRIDEPVVCDSEIFLRKLIPLAGGDWTNWMRYTCKDYSRKTFHSMKKKKQFRPAFRVCTTFQIC